MLRLVIALSLLAVLVAGCVRPDTVIPGDEQDEETAAMAPVPVVVTVLGDGRADAPVAGAQVRLLDGDATVNETTADDDGVARFTVDRPHMARVFGIRATADGWTDERIVEGFTLKHDTDGTIEQTIPLYHDTLVLTDEMTWQGPGQIRTPGAATAERVELGFSDDAALQLAYARRIDTLTVSIEWANTYTTYADFGVFIAGNGDGRVASDKAQAPLEEGTYVETVTVDRAGLLAMVDPQGPEVHYGVETDDSVVAPDDIAINVTVTATFRTPAIEVGEAVSVAPVWTLLALAMLVGLRRRA